MLLTRLILETLGISLLMMLVGLAFDRLKYRRLSVVVERRPEPIGGGMLNGQPARGLGPPFRVSHVQARSEIMCGRE